MEELTSLKAQVAILKSNDIYSSKSDVTRYRKELEYKDDKIARLENESERLFKRKQELSEAFVSKDDDALKKIERTYESLQKEISRYRKERDDMREMYESANAQVSSLTKNCSHLQLMIDGLKAKISSLELKFTQDPSSSAKSEDLLLEELSSIEKAYDLLRQHNEQLIKECSLKETSLNSVSSDKIRAEFRVAQALKDSELELKKAQDLEAYILSKHSQMQAREKTLLSQNSLLESEVSERNKSLEDLRRRISEYIFKIQELEKEKKILKGDLEEVHILSYFSLCSLI
jgi:chromosome segregation ATPase